MKKLLMTLVLLPLMALADTETVDGITWTYTINNGEAGVGAGSYQQTAISTSTKGAIVIPAILGGYPVTSIGSGAFYGCSGLTSVTIPGGVKSIGWYAFYGCSGLLSVAIPSSVTSVGGYAFEGCSGLTRVDISDLFRWCECGFVGYKSNPLYYAHHLYLNGEEITDLIIPSNVTGIGDNAFPGCEGLTSVTIPEGVKSIGDYAFEDCRGLLSVTIPEGVKSIGCSAFSGCEGLTSVTIPEGVKSIGDYAFEDCRGLLSVTIPEGVKSIGSYVFYGCSGLASVTIPEGVTSIRDYAFYGCSGLTSVSIPSSVTSIGYNAFSDCSGLTRVDISDLSKWCERVVGYKSNPLCYAHHLYLNGEEIADLIIPSSVTSIGSGAFYGCSGLTSVTIPSSVTNIGSSAFYGCSGLTSVTIPEGVTSIGSDAFSGCRGLTSVAIPSSVTSVGDYVFWNCSSLTSMTIPSGVTSIGYRAFSDCSGLESMTIPSGVTSIGARAFSGCSSLTSMTIPSGVTSIGYEAFSGCSRLVSVTIPASVTNIGNEAFEYCSGLTSVAVDPMNETYCSIDGILYTKQRLELTYCPRGRIGVVTIPEGVTSIGDNAFYNCGGLMSVTISSSVTNIGDHAFYCCPDLTSVAIPEGVTSIGDYAFNSCRSLTCVAIPSSVISIGACAFWQCNIEVVVVPEDPQECVIQCFGSQMWYQRADTPIQYEWGYSKVNNDEATITGVRPAYGDVEIPSQIGGLTVTRIGERAFESCRGLTSVKIPSSIMHIGDDAFLSCDGLTSMRIPDGVTSIGDSVFYGCVMLEDVWFADSVSTMGRNMFTKCARLSLVRIPAKIDAIPPGMFCDCWALSTVDIPAGVKTIGEMAFQHCDALERLVIPASVENISPGAFSGSSFSITVEEGNKKFLVDNGVLYDKECERLIFCPTRVSGKFTCSKSVKQIDAAAFYECTDLTSIDIGDDVMAIGERAFAGCSSLKYLSIPSTVEDITRMFAWGVSGADTILFKGLPPKGLDTITSQRIDRILYNSQFTNEWLEAADAVGLTNLEPACLVDVTFVGNGGTFGNPAGESCVCEQIVDTAYSLPAHEPVRKGYRFDGYWTETNGGTRVTSGVSVKLTKAHSLYAHWAAGQFVTVRFNATGGTVEPEERVYVSEAPFGELPAPVRTHYDFAGWFTVASDGRQVTAVSEVPLADRELFAHWTAKQYAIRFHANDGTERTTDQSFTYGATVTLVKNGFARTGYAFAGWAHDAATGMSPPLLADGAELDELTAIQDGVIHLYAVWTANRYMVKFNANSGKGTMADQAFVYDQAQALTANAFEKKDCTFVGWNVSAPRGEDASDTVFANGASVSNLTAEADGVVTLVARWKANGRRIVPGERAEINTEFGGWTASGLPRGLTFNKAAGKITGTVTATTKPGEYTVTFKKPGEADETLTIVVTEVPKLSVALVGSGTGRVSGAGEHLADAKVTLKATADAKDSAATVKSAFAGWFADADCTQPLDGTVDYRTASFPFMMPTEDVAIYAKFIPIDEDWVGVWCRPQDEYVRGGEIAPLAVEVDSASLATVKVTGLPTGLKFTAKPQTLKATNNRAAVDLPVNTIYGTPTKSGVYTATITATTAGKKSETYTVDFVVRGDGEYLVDVMGIDGADYPDNGSDAQHAIQWGKISGYGVFASGKTTTLKAMANKGYVFAGWFSDVACVCEDGAEDDGCIYMPAEGTVDYRSTSFPVKVGYEDVLYYARFVRTADDGTIGLAVNGNEVVDDSGAVRVVVKDAATLPSVVIGSVSIPKASVKGLPAGLKWDTKKNCLTGAPTKPGVYKVTFSLTNTTVKKAIVRAFTIEVPNFESPAFPGLKSASDAYPVSVGVAALPAVDAGLASAYAGYTVKVTGLPSGLTWKNGVLTGLAKKAGDYTVTFTATQGKDKQVSTITIHVEALPDWAVGTFVGMVRQVDRDERGEIIEDEDGLHDWYDILTTVSVTSAGKVSGKLHFESGTDVSFKSDSISERTDAGYVVRGQLKARGIASDFELLLRKIGIETTGVGDLGAVDVLMRQTARQEGSNWIECDETTFSIEEDAPLRQNVWSSKKLSLPPSVNGVKKTVTVEDNIYTLTFGKNGSVKVSLAKADKPTKAIASGSATLSIVGHASEVWHCELCTSVVVKKNDYGAVCIFDVTILEDGTVTCVPQK